MPGTQLLKGAGNLRRSLRITIFLVLIAILIVPTATALAAAPELAGSPFGDVSSDHPYRDDFALLSVLRIFQGPGDGTVGPDNALTREQFSKVAVSMLDRTYLVPSLAEFQPDFRDGGSMAPVWWGWVNAAEYLGLVRGFGDGYFRPNAPLTYGEATAVLLRAAGYGPHLVDLSYPRGYIAKAREIGLTGGVNLAPDIPITRGEMARMVVNAMSVHPPDSQGLPADGQTGDYRPSLLESHRDRVEGTLTDLDEQVLYINGSGYTLASRIFLVGADQLVGQTGARVVGYKNAAGNLAYLRIARGSYVSAGILTNANLSGRVVQVDDRIFTISPPEGSGEPTRWLVNGTEANPTQSLMDDMVDARDTRASVSAFNGRAEEVALRYFDVPSLSVTAEPEDIAGDWSVPVASLQNGERAEYTLVLPGDLEDLLVDGEVPSSPEELEVGDSLRIATVGAGGFGDEDTITRDRMHRVSWSRNRESGDVESVAVDEEAGFLLLEFELEDGRTLSLREDRYLGGPRDMKLNDLRHASWVDFALDADGYARLGIDALVSGTGSRYVRLIAVGELGGAYHLVVDQAGRFVTYQLSFPSLWVQFADDDLVFREGHFAELRVNASGKVEGVRTWVSPEPSRHSYMVVSVDAETGTVTVRQLNESRGELESFGMEPTLSLIEAREPAVYSADGTHLGIEHLVPGDKVRLYFSDRGEAAHIEPE